MKSKRKQFSPHIRKKVFVQHNGRCGLCGEPLKYLRKLITSAVTEADKLLISEFYRLPIERVNTKSYYDLDHIIPLCQGGTNDVSNLQPVHVHCHRDDHREGGSRCHDGYVSLDIDISGTTIGTYSRYNCPTTNAEAPVPPTTT